MPNITPLYQSFDMMRLFFVFMGLIALASALDTITETSTVHDDIISIINSETEIKNELEKSRKEFDDLIKLLGIKSHNIDDTETEPLYDYDDIVIVAGDSIDETEFDKIMKKFFESYGTVEIQTVTDTDADTETETGRLNDKLDEITGKLNEWFETVKNDIDDIFANYNDNHMYFHIGDHDNKMMFKTTVESVQPYLTDAHELKLLLKATFESVRTPDIDTELDFKITFEITKDSEMFDYKHTKPVDPNAIKRIVLASFPGKQLVTEMYRVNDVMTVDFQETE